MSAKKKSRPRGRPRSFDPQEAVATAQSLFHARGYDAVSVADITDALGINPPSLYAAFGNKVGLYTLALENYSGTSGLPLDDILSPDRPVATCLAALLEEAARRYAADPAAPGCLVLEGTRCQDPEARAAACAMRAETEDRIRRYIAERHPEEAVSLTDFVITMTIGMSAMARSRRGLDRLLATARIASLATSRALTD